MTVYRGQPGGRVTVSIGRHAHDRRPLEHHVQHSPTGFAWGYGGSGPADLARSILWDHLGAEPHPVCYQAFKFAVVANWAQDGEWMLDTADVDRWLATYDGPVRLGDDVLAEL